MRGVRVDKVNMIVFDLKCLCGCQFEGWFEDRNDFERQLSGGLLGCPECGGTAIHKIFSPVKTISNAVPGEVVHPDQVKDEVSAEVVQFFQTVEKFVEDNFADVGPDLAREALKMRYGVSEPKNIRGCATEDEEKLLREEGIELLKIPILKKSSDPKVN